MPKIQKKNTGKKVSKKNILAKEMSTSELEKVDAKDHFEHAEHVDHGEPSTHTQSSPKRSNTALVIAMVLVILSIAYFTFGKTTTVAYGDKVSIDYTGSFENGSVFDTNIRGEAELQGIYNPKRPYAPLEFIVGNGQVISGLEEGIIKMKKGETKKIVIPPQKAYGLYDKSAIVTIPRVEKYPVYELIPRIEKISYPDFVDAFKATPKGGSKYTVDKSGEYFTIVGMDGKNITLERTAPIGTHVKLSNLPWSAEVVNVSNKYITLKQSPPKSGVLQTLLGNATVTTTETQVILLVSPSVGTVIPYQGKLLKVIEVSNDLIYLDANHPLAGKTLIFDVKMDDIVKKK